MLMSQAVEDRMTAALVITCKRKSCGKQFFKTEGCNHMTCPCGAHYCYECGEQLGSNPYEHFGRGRCRQYMDTERSNEHSGSLL